MKRYLMTILAVVLTTLTVKAMPYEMAREEAMYLTDKMAYELNLNQRQYEYAYEINLDYLMSLNRAEDAYGMFLMFRNDDLRHILYDWQWRLFSSLDYFLRPVTWRYGRWYYPIYGYYARNYYYYSRPAVYHNYRGGHGRGHYNNGFYANRRPQWVGGFRGADRGHATAHGNNPGMGSRGPQGGQQPTSGGNRGQQGGQQPTYGGNRGQQGGQQPAYGGNRGQQGVPTMGGSRGGNMGGTPTRGTGNAGGGMSAGRGHGTTGTGRGGR